MPAERVTMRTINDILRLNETCQLSHRQIAKSCGVARSTVAEILRRATAAGVSWPLPVEVNDAILEARLYPETPPTTGTSRPVPEWATVHQPRIPTATSTAASVTDMASGSRPWIGVCATSIGRARSCSSMMRGRLCRCAPGPPGNSARRRSSWRCWEPPTIPMPRRPGLKRCRIGRPRMFFTEKTRYLFKIHKGLDPHSTTVNPYRANEAIDEHARRIPFQNMIYVGDGLTDIPCCAYRVDSEAHNRS